MTMQTLNEILPTVFGYLLALVFGALVSLIVTRWGMRKDSDVRLTAAAEDIRRAAARIAQIEQSLLKQDEILEEIKTFKEAQRETRGNVYTDVLLTTNSQLFARLNQEALDKRAIGKYISKYVSKSSILAIDCGTTTAWAFYEIIRSGHGNLRVITNNIFVASTISEECELTEKADIWGAQEVASNCYLFPGYYFPSYGGILNTEAESEDFYLNQLEVYKPNMLLLGCTSFRANDGPHARSGPNRRCKRSFLRYAISHKDVSLYLLMSIAKIGIQIGEPCGSELWTALNGRRNVHIVCGTRELQNKLDKISDSQRAIINEEIRLIIKQKSKNQILLVDDFGSELDLKANAKIP